MSDNHDINSQTNDSDTNAQEKQTQSSEKENDRQEPAAADQKSDMLREYYWYVKSNKAVYIKSVLSEIEQVFKHNESELAEDKSSSATEPLIKKIERLRKLSCTEFGLVNKELRRRAWPILLNVNCLVKKEGAVRSFET